MDSLINDLGILAEVKSWHLGLAISYFLGSIPFGLLITRIFLGYDVRLEGSGNIGMTNVMRGGGKLAGLATLVLDAGKATLGVWLTAAIFEPPSVIVLAAGAAAVLGHTNSIFLGFKGGKGVASNFGIWMIIDWRVFAAIVAVWGLTFIWKRISGVASITALAVLPLTAAWLRGISSATILAFLISLYLIILHRSNIRRLLRGEEPAITGSARREFKRNI